MVPEVTSFQPSPSQESPFTSPISLDSACPCFHAETQRSSFNSLFETSNIAGSSDLVPLLLYLLHPCPPPEASPREKSPPDLQSHILSQQLLKGA